MAISIQQYFPDLARAWGRTVRELQTYWGDLQADRAFLQKLNEKVQGVPEFSGVVFRHVDDLRAYRNLLYLFARVTRPEVMVETGVQNGFGSAFLLQALAHNGAGTLLSIDLPPVEKRILQQGTRGLPIGKSPGWVIPDDLRDRNQLVLGPAEKLLPCFLDEHGQIDAFLHDSDHAYPHMMFEMGLAWRFLKPGGWILADNIEQNLAFAHFTQGVGVQGFVVASFDTPERVWKTGLFRKPGGPYPDAVVCDE